MDWQTRKEYLKQFPVEIPYEAFNRYADILLDWNERMNLTRITDSDQMMDKHFIDSLTPTLLDHYEGTGKILDLGTGAGFPGMVLAMISPKREVHLMDSLNKRITFLDYVVDELALSNVRTFHARAEEAGRDAKFREQYQVVLSRAVARLPILAEYCLPFVHEGGCFIAMKGSEGVEEVKEAARAFDILGGKIDKVVDLHLPGGDERHLIVVKKVKATPEKYPRGSGKPRKDPL
ncbi:MAG: 16S rRNA (guanine(527)-N(7))-methyltransferase RsmG [Peptoniphilus sp.]|nr:16S rRNA (guanine(527)-N(7))-methyltransferase RsmG [Peptoniphilus sp.]MDY3118311.1 16S rRNA (guanine(527)-N(7))-methyltransferase RsmG [Peptoniphilus sp.]